MTPFARRGNAFVLILAFWWLSVPPVALAQTTTPTVGATILAAASMQTALDAIAASWTAQTGLRPSVVYGSSAVIARQIEHGAPADIFISADSPIVYPVAILVASKNSEAAPFVDYLSSPSATKILLDQGFTIIPK
jgi:ABC-type molybdate transport system substrate-binding protein